MFARIARFCVERPWKVVAAWLVLIAAVAALSPTVDSVVNQDDTSFVPESYESSQANALEDRAFPESSKGSSVLVYKRRDGAKLTPADQAAIGRSVKELDGLHVAT